MEDVVVVDEGLQRVSLDLRRENCTVIVVP